MEVVNIKTSNYVGQVKKKNEKSINDHLVNVDKDLQNLRQEINKIISYLPGKTFADINLSAEGLGVGATAPDNVVVSSSNIFVKGFAGVAIIEEVHGSFEIPTSWKVGTSIEPHLHWMPTTNGMGNVKWQLEYMISGTSVLVSSTTITFSQSVSGLAWVPVENYFPIITGTALAFGNSLLFRLFRDPTDLADTYGADAAVSSFSVHFEQDTLGSSTKDAK